MNLIVTCARHLEPDAEDELRGLLGELGDSEPEITVTDMSGILVADTKLEPVETVRGIREKLVDEPWSVRYCLRVIPIQTLTESKVEGIVEEAARLGGQIDENETYRISIEKRDSDVSSRELIAKIADKFSNKVSLNHPDKIILVEILGSKAGISILKKSDILSTEKTKRSISEQD